MLPTDAILLLAGMTVLLIVVRYADAWWFFRGNALRLRQLATVPWPMRSKLARPSYFAVTRSLVIPTKLITLLLTAPIVTGLALAMQPEWVTTTDVIVTVLSGTVILCFAILDRRILAALRKRYDVPSNWRSLLR